MSLNDFLNDNLVFDTHGVDFSLVTLPLSMFTHNTNNVPEYY